ncbi:MAG: diacylglycerol kinase [Pseudomonadota bacterium]
MLKYLAHTRLRLIWTFAGLAETWRKEQSFRYWAMVNAVSILAALALPIGAPMRALILALGLLILAAELMNTGIERAVDYISTDNHPLAKAAKDAGCAAVAVTAFSGGVAWVVALVALAL